MYGPGRYVPDLTEGMTTVKDRNSTKITLCP